MRKAAVGGLVGLVLASLLYPGSAVASDRAAARAAARAIEKVPVGPDAYIPRFDGAKLDLRAPSARLQRVTSVTDAAVGDTKDFLTIDFVGGFYFFKTFTLRGLGDHIEVWVASSDDDVSSGLDFQPGDCRNGARTIVTDEQVQNLVDQFDNNMFPIETAAFSTPPARDGSAALLDPPGYYAGEGDNIITLIDNFRDENFYDLNNTQGFTYVAGYYDSFAEDLYDRLTMHIDAFDWIHRTGANPPHEPVAGDNCTSAPARPFLYEGVFAHEWQHQLENYEDPFESNWINEGLSDWAQTITGYVNPATPVTQVGFDSHINCFTGFGEVQTDANPNPRPGGPENSLTAWGDQDFDHPQEILCDYGAAYSMMEYLAGLYGGDFMRDLHRDDLTSLESLSSLLAGAGGPTARETIEAWAAMMALDGIIDDGADLHGGDVVDYTTPTLDSTILWDNDDAYDTPGAPPNGSDYVQLRRANGKVVTSSGQVKSVSFDGSEQLAPLPIEWTVDATMGNPAPSLHSGKGDNLDRTIVREVDVPAANPVLAFDTQWSTETGFDYAYVQVSTDGGTTYDSIECANTNTEGPLGPAYEGESDGFIAETCDLRAYAGQKIVIAFRYVTDASVQFDGFWVDNVALNSTELSDGSTLEGWQSLTQYNPIEVDGWTVQLLRYTKKHKDAYITRLPLNAGFEGHANKAWIRHNLGRGSGVIAAIVTYWDSTGTVQQYAPYVLEVNGDTQPGGS